MNKVDNVKRVIQSTNGKIFHVRFVKADGSIREMTCRTGVSKHTKGGEAYYKANSDNIGVYELNSGREGAENYRCFNANRVLSIKSGGEEHSFE